MGGRRGGREVQERGDICMHTADSLHCTAETNTTLQSNYTPIKKKRKFSLGYIVRRLLDIHVDMQSRELNLGIQGSSLN